MTRSIRWFDTGARHPNELLRLLRETFAGTGAAMQFVAPYCRSAGSLPVRRRALESYANWDYFAARFPGMANGLIVTTSGSTGYPKQTLLSGAALEAAATASASALGGHGQWLAALPLHYIAGLQVLFRSLQAGTAPVYVKSVSGPGAFCVEDFVTAAERLEGSRRYTSLVPTQLEKLLSFLDRDGRERPPEDRFWSKRLAGVLQRFDAVLLGGSAATSESLAKAKKLGINIVTTYGMTETAGGCVYNGISLPRARILLDGGDIALGGPALACGYLEDRADSPKTCAAFADRNGSRFFRTQDVGRFVRDRLIVDGRRDDIIISGGLKLSPAYLRGRLNAFPEIADSFVTYSADPYWGQQIVAVVEPSARPFDVPKFTAKLRKSALAPAERPKRVVPAEKIPYLPSGKVDRLKIGSIIRDAW